MDRDHAGAPPAAPESLTADAADSGSFYVFAYGSLIWNPGFPYASRHLALVRGLHRRFCLWSHRYRGTPERPGLVLGLDRGGSCMGVAYRVPESRRAEVLDYLDDRELPDGSEQVYDRRAVRLTLADQDHRPATAITYVARRACRMYCGPLAPEDAARTIAAASGQTGTNRDYLANTVAHLREFGVRDRALERIHALVG
jgi:cation transport protein ChaC